MSKNCGKCGKSFTVNKKWKRKKGDYITPYVVERWVEDYDGLCEKCVENLILLDEDETEVKKDE